MSNVWRFSVTCGSIVIHILDDMRNNLLIYHSMDSGMDDAMVFYMSDTTITKGDEMTFYDAIKHIDHNNHESDLYLLATDEARQIMKAHSKNGRPFKDNVNGKIYYDIPFAYQPWWDKRLSPK